MEQAGVLDPDHKSESQPRDSKSNEPYEREPFKIEFLKISYDRIFTSNQREYCEQHPEVDYQEAFDIIRGKTDQDYLDAITYHCEFDNN